MKQAAAWALALIILASVGLGFGVLAERTFNGVSGEVALGALTFFGTTWFAIWSFNKTKRKEAEALIFPQKAAIYQELIDIIRDVVFAQKGWIPQVDPDALAQRFAKARFDMIVWGGQDTIRAIEQFELNQGSSPGRMFSAVADLYASVRKEMGHTDDLQLRNDLFLAQIALEDREKVRDQMISGV